MDFGLARFDTVNRTLRLELPEISADPKAPLTLIVAQLHNGNSRYNEWLIKHAAPDESSIPKENTPEWRDYNDRRNIELLGAAAVRGWQNVLADGGSVECTPEHVVEFLGQLCAARRDTFQRVVRFCADEANWKDEATPPTDPVKLGKE